MKAFPNSLIRASAGTGKTFQLTNRYLGLLHAEVPPEEILATTFTRKAAGEILDRVVLRLADAASDDTKAAELARFIQSAGVDQPRCRELLRRVVQQLHRLRVGTLDSFFAQIAGSFGLELGMPLGWTIADEQLDAQLRARAIELVLRGGEKQVRELMHLLTKGEAERTVSRLLHDTVDDLYSLYLETPADAWRCVPRPKRLTGEKLATVLEEFTAIELPDLKTWKNAHAKTVEAAQTFDWADLIGKGIGAGIVSGGNKYYKRDIPPEVIAAYAPLIAHARAEILNQLADQTEATHGLLARFDAEYQRLKHEAGVLRFEDVTRGLANSELVRDVARLEHRLDAQIAHLLLDEFQDTSLSQWAVVRPFAERVTGTRDAEAEPQPGAARSFFCVGDPKQAIYGWRGGVAEIFDALEQQLVGLQTEPLNCSFRSAQPIIDVVNRIFSRLTQHPKLERAEPAVAAWRQRFEQHSTDKTELPGYVTLEVAPELAADEQGKAVVQCAAHRVAQLAEQSPGRSIGVLTRTNALVGQTIHKLRELGVPASEEGGNPLSNSAAVQLILSLLRLADHPAHTIARMHVAHSPLGAAVGLTDFADDEQAARVASDVRRQLLTGGYGPSIYRWVKALAGHCSHRELARLRQLVEMAYDYESGASLRATDFVKLVEDQRVSDPSSADVRVMTIHQAKGLQFDIVVAAELDFSLTKRTPTYVVGQPGPTEPIDRVCRYVNQQMQALLPADLQAMFASATDGEVTEMLCMLYVAVTRPIHALHMILAPTNPGEKNLPKTAAGLLRASLTEGEAVAPGDVLYTHGDPRWFEELDPAAESEPAEDLPSLAVRLAPGEHVDLREPEVVAPSSLEGGSHISLGGLLRIDNQAAFQQGSLIHAWFEQIEWLDDGRPDEDALRAIAQSIDHGGLKLNEQLQRFAKMLAQPAIAAALTRSYYTGRAGAATPQVHNEQQFAVRTDAGGIARGAIDRLVLFREAGRIVGAEIIDFKTDALDADNPAAVAAKLEYYRPQVEAYRSGVARMYRLPREAISARLLFVSPGLDCTVCEATQPT
jgi:ATP-dependent exoDNAse (exonuclease V) beta subunit